MSEAAAPTAPMAPVSRENRPSIVGPDAPEPPYPMQLHGVVTKGFGRGARFLGIPTGKYWALHALEPPRCYPAALRW